MAPLLSIDKLQAVYDDFLVLHEVTLTVEKGQITALVGANAAGKTTTLNAVSGLVKVVGGRIAFRGQDVTSLAPHERAALGLIQIPEGRQIFPFMTVLENLRLGAYLPKPRRSRAANLRRIYDLLPVLEERKSQMAGLLSGGEQQMLAIGRGLMAEPELLMLDEPSLGLAPMYVEKIFELVKTIKDEGTTILLVEQNVHHALSLADQGYVLENGRLTLEGPGRTLLGDSQLVTAYMGI
ncbi:MAG: ABC transporter ATP-binding protein [Deltaproteobacteria bacterium]|jgi:branched-chain amino acid transport system ATP-binding protein|nr:ABC transporter ATP-binding protein [Deltaproteobacteria bacterium]